MKKYLLIPLFLSLCVGLTACAGFNAAGTTSGEPEVDETPVDIAQSDADQLLSEKLDGLGVRAIFLKKEILGEEGYYTYKAVDKDNNDLEEMLAVNAISGEVYVYLPDTKKLQDFKTFSHYDESQDEDVSWEGSFVLGKISVELDPADGNSFEFTIKKDGKTELGGVAYAEGKRASYEDDKVSLTFERDGSTLEIKDTGDMSGYAGIYEAK